MHLDQILVELSAAAYTQAPDWSVGDVHAIRRDLAPNLVAVAFRGTCCIDDAKRDARAWPVRDPHLGFVHEGFLIGARTILPLLRRDLAGKRVILTGHSLGGALALVVAALMVAGAQDRLGRTGWQPVDAVVTYGAPKAAFRQMRRVLERVPAIRQYRLADDPVPCVPWFFGLWVHMVPHLIHLLPDDFDLDCVNEHHVERYRRFVALSRADRLSPEI